MKKIFFALVLVGVAACDTSNSASSVKADDGTVHNGGENGDGTFTAEPKSLFVLTGSAAKKLYSALDIQGVRHGFNTTKTFAGQVEMSCEKSVQNTATAYSCSAAQAQAVVDPTGACSADAQVFGPFPSSCGCPEGYTYGGAQSGKCILDDGRVFNGGENGDGTFTPPQG